LFLFFSLYKKIKKKKKKPVQILGQISKRLEIVGQKLTLVNLIMEILFSFIEKVMIK
jgi:hypothetical protein